MLNVFEISLKDKHQVKQLPYLFVTMEFSLGTCSKLYLSACHGEVKVAQSCLTLCELVDYTVHGILPARIPQWVAFPSPGDLPNPGIKPRSPALWADSLPAEPQAKPKNTGVGSLSLLQRIFWTQESNQGLLHCRRILYQLNY